MDGEAEKEDELRVSSLAVFFDVNAYRLEALVTFDWTLRWVARCMHLWGWGGGLGPRL